ncbi:MAG: hypothetical protein E7539_03110 [Ruminococcaceae bacterium]|nr:hypothetical protein [Oscillospiraceae bacterium]
MKREKISMAISNIDKKYITEAENYAAPAKKAVSIRSIFIKLPVAACLIACLLVGTGAYAAYEIYEWSSSILFEDGTKVDVVENMTYKNIPETAPKTIRTEDSVGSLRMTHQEVQKALGFKILNYEGATSDEMVYRTGLNDDGSIGRVDLWWAYFVYENEDKNISLSISMLNKGADLGYVLAFQEGLDAAGGKKLEDTVTIESLNTKAVVYTDRSHSNKLAITFVYDNVIYDFLGFDYTQEEMLSVIEQLK